MVENVNKKYKKSDFLTALQFSTKYGIKNNDLVKEIVTLLYRQHRFAKNNTGNLIPVIQPKTRLIHPLFHDIILEEINKRNKLPLLKTKEVSK